MYTDLNGRIWTDEQMNEAWKGAEAHVLSKEVELERLRAERDDLAAKLEAANAIIARIDKIAPRADATCWKPGIKLSTAVRHQLRDEGHPLFKDAQPKS